MPKPAITEHALLRYCERVMGADRAWIAERIDEQLPHSANGTLLDGTHKIERGRFNAVVQGGVIVTIINIPPLSRFRRTKEQCKAARYSHEID